MRTALRVLSEDERSQVHERTLCLLATTGVRVDTARGRQILAGAGAEVDEHTGTVHFPRALARNLLAVGAAPVQPGRPPAGLVPPHERRRVRPPGRRGRRLCL